MKKFLLSLTLFTALLGITLSANAQPCTVQNLVFNIKSFSTPTGTGSCTMTVDIGWTLANNNGFVESSVHLWGANYPSPPYEFKPGAKAPDAAFLANALGTIHVSRPNNGALSSWTISAAYPYATTKMISTGTLTVTSVAGGFNFSIIGAQIELPNCQASIPSVTGDVWGSTNRNGVSCGNNNVRFLLPTPDFNVTGTLNCGFKDGYPNNTFNVNVTSSGAITVSYDVYVDQGATTFDPAVDLKVGNRTVTGITTYPYNSTAADYLPYSIDYAYIGKELWISATGTYTQNGGGTFTKQYKIANTCTVPTPTINPDYFPELSHPLHTIKANVYGGSTRWTTELGAGSDYATKSANESPATNAGLDNNPTDAPLANMLFTLVPGSYQEVTSCAGEGTVDFTFNSNGTFSIDRTNKICVYRVTFQYYMTNQITTLQSTPVTVTVDFTPQSILPVTYASFTATRNSNSQVVLEWETAMEEANRGFHVQRMVNGEWKNIGFVFTQAANGNSSSRLKYMFKDANSSKGISQYRILQVDIDGKGRYSEVRSIRGEEMAARLTLFPNPSNTGAFSILFEDATSLRDVRIMDVSGRVVKQFKSISSNSLNVDGLTGGFYTVQVHNHTTGSSAVEKVIIKKR